MAERWKPERIAELTELRDKGLSATLIAQRMGLASRNSVLGKLHRLGLTFSGEPERMVRPHRPKQGNQQLTVPKKPKPQSSRIEQSVGAVDIFGLRSGLCRWPLWADDGGGERLYCGGASETGGTYCKGHQMRSRTKVQS
jgi:GcrA cell cycle regulator